MAIVTSTPNEENRVSVYDIPDNVLNQYAIEGEKAAQMFPESNKPANEEIPRSSRAMSPTRVQNLERVGEVQAYSDWCVCRHLVCNADSCWWVYYCCWC